MTNFKKMCQLYVPRRIENDDDYDIAINFFSLCRFMVDVDIEPRSKTFTYYMDCLQLAISDYERRVALVEQLPDSEVLENLQVSHQLTDSELADALKVSVATLRKIREGKRDLTREEIQDLWDKYKVRPESFFIFKEN